MNKDILFKILSKICNIINWIIDKAILTMLIISLILGGYSLYDTWMIYDKANDDEILALKPSNNENEEENDYSFESLLALNEDVIGWISIDDNKIDYPILQGDSNFTYINTDVYGNYSLSGSIFMDYRNSSTLLDSYSIIYGHHMENDGMFGALDYFLEQSYFDNHKTGTLYTLSNTYELKLFAVIECDAYDMNYYTPRIDEDISDIIQNIKNDAIASIEENYPLDNDKVVALSTCSSASTNGRTIVFGCFTPK